MVIAAASDPVFARLAAAIGRPEMAQDEHFATGRARVENEAACDAAITAWTQERTTAEIEESLTAAEVPAARIYTVKDIFQDAHYRYRQMLVETQDRELGPVTLAGIVPKLSRTPGAVRSPGPRLGEDSYEILGRELKLSTAELDALVASGVVVAATTFGTEDPTTEAVL